MQLTTVDKEILKAARQAQRLEDAGSGEEEVA